MTADKKMLIRTSGSRQLRLKTVTSCQNIRSAEKLWPGRKRGSRNPFRWRRLSLIPLVKRSEVFQWPDIFIEKFCPQRTRCLKAEWDKSLNLKNRVECMEII